MNNIDITNTNFVPRGKFDKNIYRNSDIDERLQTFNFLGNFKDNGKLSWNLDKFNSYEIFDNDVPTDKMKVIILKSHETVNTKSSDI